MKKINQTEGNIDYLLLTGDTVGHYVSIKRPAPDKPELYSHLKLIHQKAADYLAKYFPNTVVLKTLGNNDIKNHYQSPDGLDKEEFYSYTFKIYFSDHPKNSKLPEIDSI